MRRYRLPTGRVRPCQPNTRLERSLQAKGGRLVEDDDPTLLDGVDAKVVAELEGLGREDRWLLVDWARAVQAAEGSEPAPQPGLLDMGDPAEIFALAEEFDHQALEALIRNETDGRNRADVLAGLEQLKKNAPGNPAKVTKKERGAQTE